MPQVLFIVGVVALLLAFVALVVTLMLFIRLKIPAVIGELTGQTATAEIARIRAEGISRQAKGRSLQSIIGQETGSGSFDLQKLGLQTSGRLSTGFSGEGVESHPLNPAPSQLSIPTTQAAWAEPMTELLTEHRTMAEPMTELLEANTVWVEPMTELLKEDPAK
ncbi:MAG: hypothetical protein LBG68_00815 [Coriobacteriales bacterium]|nr:hypothetical protein [Coriobacteriales bacterium]